MRKYAILLDGGFVLQRLKSQLKRVVRASDVTAYVDQIRSHGRLASDELLRALFYDAPPAQGRVKHPISQSELLLEDSPFARSRQSLLDQLAESNDIAVRLGELRNQGWKIGDSARKSLIENPRTLEARDVIPNLTQKGVDIRIGLDIARLTLRSHVDAIVLSSGDTDFIPAMAFARREGTQLYLDTMGAPVPRELRVHADYVFAG